jgi:SulP family sulfate permease
MTGFLTGLSILIVLGQLGDLTGYHSPYREKVRQAIDLLRNLREVQVETTLIGVVTILVIVLLSRTRVQNFALFIALLVAAVLVPVLNFSQVALVGAIPEGLPLPKIPQLILAPDLILGGIAIAIIGLVQGAGVSQVYVNPDGKYPDVSRDFVGQCIANAVVGFFQGLPVGGSLSSTALVVGAGAKSRIANIFAGLVVMVGVLLFGNQIEQLPMAALAAILIVAGVQSIKPEHIRTVWQTSVASRGVMLFTLIVTLLIPIQLAVLLGILVHFVLHIFRSSDKVRVEEIVVRADGGFEECVAPKELTSNSVTVLLPYGSLFFAGAVEFEEHLPMRAQLGRTGVLQALGEENIYTATPIIGETTRRAVQDAQVWLWGTHAVDEAEVVP